MHVPHTKTEIPEKGIFNFLEGRHAVDSSIAGASPLWRCHVCRSEHLKTTKKCMTMLFQGAGEVTVLSVGAKGQDGGRQVCNHYRCNKCKTTWREPFF